jgi:hypothetical protein
VIVPKILIHNQDTSFSYGVHTVHAKPTSMKHDIGDGLPGGSTWTWDSSQSVTDHVGFSTSVSADIETIVSASVETDVSEDKTYTSGTSTTINIQCEAYVPFTPPILVVNID